MKVLYAIQGTGNGHLSRARDIIPQLQKRKIDLDILISGTQADVRLPYPITYHCNGLSFSIGNNGGIDLWKTYLNAKTLQLNKEIANLPVEQYDLVINDFEPVSAWACKLKNKPCVSLSHQVAVLAPNAPKSKKADPVGKVILKKYAPTTRQYGFHFKPYHRNIFTPVIRQDIRNISCKTNEHYTVYLPAYTDEAIYSRLSQIKGVSWEVFSINSKKTFVSPLMTIKPISNEAFVYSMATSKGILCGAGFETPAEALFLQKKLMVIPMKGQYEQQCNAAALKEMGVPVLKSLKEKHLDKIRKWVENDRRIQVDYPDQTADIIEQLLDENL